MRSKNPNWNDPATLARIFSRKRREKVVSRLRKKYPDAFAQGDDWLKEYKEARTPPDLEPVFKLIPRPSGGVREIISVPDIPEFEKCAIEKNRRKKSLRLSNGIVCNQVVFGMPGYRLVEQEWNKFEASLDEALKAPGKFKGGNREAHEKLQTAITNFEAKCGGAYGRILHHLVTLGPGGQPFFNPVYFPREHKHAQIFWRFVDNVRQLYHFLPAGQNRGRSLSMDRYQRIADEFGKGKSRAEIADEHGLSMDQVEKAETAMGLKRRQRR